MDMDIGKHCGVPDCRLRDFLPFSCDACAGVFCLEHRTYAGHACARAHAKQQLAIKCPVCKATLTLRGDEDPNLVWEQHQLRDGCDVSKRKKRNRCPAAKCKEVLGPTNTAGCGHCGQNFCLRHRFKDDHACQGRPPRGVAGWFTASSPAPAPPRRQTPVAAARPPPPRRQPAPVVAADPNNTLRGSADRRRRGNGGAPGGAYPGQAHRQQQQQQQQDVIDLTGDASPARPPRAQQQQPRQQQPGVTVDGGCPFCGVVLHDPVALVAHVESQHPGGGGAGTRMPPEHSSYCHVG